MWYTYCLWNRVGPVVSHVFAAVGMRWRKRPCGGEWLTYSLQGGAGPALSCTYRLQRGTGETSAMSRSITLCEAEWDHKQRSARSNGLGAEPALTSCGAEQAERQLYPPDER